MERPVSGPGPDLGLRQGGVQWRTSTGWIWDFGRMHNRT